MSDPVRSILKPIQKSARLLIEGPQVLAFLPAITLAAYWFGGDIGLVLTAGAVPLIWLALGGRLSGRGSGHSSRMFEGLIAKDDMQPLVDRIIHATQKDGTSSALFMLELDDYSALLERHGQMAADRVVKETGERLVTTLRDGDAVAQVGDCRFAIVLRPSVKLDLEAAIQLSGRFQTTIEEPISVDGLAVYMSACVGFCLARRSPEVGAEPWVKAAGAALKQSQQRGPSSIRAYSAELHRVTEAREMLRTEVAEALSNGEIRPWFQPQISTDTGRVTGFEALARWNHPERGLIPPSEFLPAIEEAGMLEELADAILVGSLDALQAWDSAGLDIPQVGVNFSGSELNNPRLVEKIRWELDRFDLTPDRLAIEILETVVATAPDDMITRNIKGLNDLGCRIDLDDFGTGHASIASIRRFGVTRIKIDRSFVMKADRDAEQQRMIAAILTMAERLGIETLAEGVETVGEHALLAQLGCDHVQGFGIGRPVPFEETLDWVHLHEAKLQDTPQITARKGK